METNILLKGLIDAINSQSSKLDNFIRFALGKDIPNSDPGPSNSNNNDNVEINEPSNTNNNEHVEHNYHNNSIVVDTDDTIDHVVNVPSDSSNPTIDASAHINDETNTVIQTDHTVGTSIDKGKYGNMLVDHKEEIKADKPVDDQLASNIDYMLTHHLDERPWRG